MADSDKEKWDKRYSVIENLLSSPANVLLENLHLLPPSGIALDLACGRGANAICLAENGLTVSAWDISSTALEQLSHHANERNLTVNTALRDVSKQPPETNTFDVIIVSHFLDRDLTSSIKNAIKQNGLIFYQTFIKEKASESGPKNPDYLLDNNELLIMFNDWKIICYREEGKTGNINDGFRNQAMLVAKKT